MSGDSLAKRPRVEDSDLNQGDMDNSNVDNIDQDIPNVEELLADEETDGVPLNAAHFQHDELVEAQELNDESTERDQTVEQMMDTIHSQSKSTYFYSPNPAENFQDILKIFSRSHSARNGIGIGH